MQNSDENGLKDSGGIRNSPIPGGLALGAKRKDWIRC